MGKRQEMREAIAFLIELLEMGVEYADAQYQTTVSFEVNPDELQQEYDYYMATQGLTLE